MVVGLQMGLNVKGKPGPSRAGPNKSLPLQHTHAKRLTMAGTKNNRFLREDSSLNVTPSPALGEPGTKEQEGRDVQVLVREAARGWQR